MTGVGRRSIQGDVAFADALARMGAIVRMGDDWIEAAAGDALRGITLDCVAIPDAAMTLAVVALFARGPTTLTGIASWRVKETDRIAAMATELAKLGARAEAGADRLTIHPPERLRAATIDTYDDHRMAMCFSLAAFGGVRDPDQRPGVRAQDVSRLLRTRSARSPGHDGKASIMSAAGPPEGANCSPLGGSAAAECTNEAASVGGERSASVGAVSRSSQSTVRPPPAREPSRRGSRRRWASTFSTAARFIGWSP